jgi:hypothetical protein
VKNIPWLFSILLLFLSVATSQTQRVPADVVARLRSQAQLTYVHTQIPHDEEYIAAVLSNGSVVYTMVGDRGGKLSLPLAIVLLLHTHPYGARPLPSDLDKATANRIAAPNCVVTAAEVQCALPDGKILAGELLGRRQSRCTSRSLQSLQNSRKIHLLGNSCDSSSFNHAAKEGR